MTLDEWLATFSSAGAGRVVLGRMKSRYKDKEPAYVVGMAPVKRNTNAHRALCHWLKVNAGQQGNKWFEMNATSSTWVQDIGFMEKEHAVHFLLTHGKAV